MAYIGPIFFEEIERGVLPNQYAPSAEVLRERSVLLVGLNAPFAGCEGVVRFRRLFSARRQNAAS